MSTEYNSTDQLKASYLSTEPSPDSHWRIAMENKVVAITGACRGIGLGIAEVLLANSCAKVYSLDLLGPNLEEHSDYHALSNKYPDQLHYINCDVTIPASIDNALDQIVVESGRFDGMIANAVITKHQPALNFSTEQLENMFNLNVFGVFHCATSAARVFKKLRCQGSIVFTSSMTSYRPNRAAPSAPYGATKAATRNLTHTLAMEWAQDGIRVNSVSPGFVRTQMTTYYVDRDPEEWQRKMQNYGRMPRLAEPRELGGAYVYLLSDAVSYTTGIAGVVGAW